MGLGLALATALLITEGVKDIIGRPRPDLLARCDPDISQIRRYTVSGYNAMQESGVLVSSGICRQTDRSLLDDGFASFPSGHSSCKLCPYRASDTRLTSIVSFAGLTYLTLFLCAKFAISIPFLAPQNSAVALSTTAFGSEPSPHTSQRQTDVRNTPPTHLFNRAAAPPVYLLILAFFPVGVATFVAGSRFSDFRHHGFDVIAGSIIGLVCAWFGFRWYHLPVRQGAGWAWGARSRERAFGVPVGVSGYVGDEGWSTKNHDEPRDLEEGRAEGSEDPFRQREATVPSESASSK